MQTKRRACARSCLWPRRTKRNRTTTPTIGRLSLLGYTAYRYIECERSSLSRIKILVHVISCMDHQKVIGQMPYLSHRLRRSYRGRAAPQEVVGQLLCGLKDAHARASAHTCLPIVPPPLLCQSYLDKQIYQPCPQTPLSSSCVWLNLLFTPRLRMRRASQSSKKY